MLSHGAVIVDQRLANVIYDEKYEKWYVSGVRNLLFATYTNKNSVCSYFVDYEDTYIRNDGLRYSFEELDFVCWDLARQRDDGQIVYE